MGKRQDYILKMMLQVFLFVVLVSSSVSALAQSTIQQGVVYTLVGDDHYEVTAYDASTASTPLIIANSINGKPVTVISSYAFDATSNTDCIAIKQVRVGSNITEIAPYAFYHCEAMTSITLPEGLKSIGNSAFYACKKLEEITLPSTMDIVETSAFFDCKSLKKLIVKGSGLTIGTSAFMNCPSLGEIEATESCPVVGSTAFYGTGTDENPVSVLVSRDRLGEYYAAMTGGGHCYSWISGMGKMVLQIVKDGIRYNYIAPEGNSAATFEIVGFDVRSLPNVGNTGSTVYYAKSDAEVDGISVRSISEKTCSYNFVGSICAIDFRSSSLSGVEVSRSSGVFKGVSPYTMVYMPDGNSSSENNVVIGGHIASTVVTSEKEFTASEVIDGTAAYMLNIQWNTKLFGQQIGVDEAPVPMANESSQQVWRVTFVNGDNKSYRYALTDGTVTLPTAAEMGFDADTPVTYYLRSYGSDEFTTETPIASDCKVYVCPKALAVSISSSSFDVKQSASDEERTCRLTAQVTTEGARQNIIWSTSDPEVATVSSGGVVVAVGAGDADIMARASDNPNARASCHVHVQPRPTSVTINEKDFYVVVTAEHPLPVTYQLTATILPEEADKDVIWSSEKEEIAKVDEKGLVTVLSLGTTFIHATPKDNPGMYAAVKIVAQRPKISVSEISLDHHFMSLNLGDSAKLAVTVIPKEAPQYVTWSSSDENVITVNDEGKLNTVGQGRAKVYVRSTNYEEMLDSCTVEVVGKAFEFEKDSITYVVSEFSDNSKTLAVKHIDRILLYNSHLLTFPDTMTVGKNLMYVTSISDDAIGEVTNNSLVFIPQNISYSGHAANVIVEHENGDKTCERMVLTDTASFSMPFKVTVKELVYQRRLASRIHPYAVCLPYSMQSTSDGLQFFGFEKAEGDSLIFREITGDTEAYVPYLVVSHTDITDLGGNDVVLNSRSRNTDMYDGAYGFIGSLSPISNGEAVQMKACSLSDNGDWQRITSGGERILSFRSWLYNTSAEDGFIKLVPALKPVVVVTPDAVSISPSELEMERGQSVRLSGTVFPDGASQMLMWQSSNPSVATVKDDGTVTGLSWGRTVIKATSISNMQLSDSCIVTVRGINDKETVNDIEYTINKTGDESKTVTITHIGSNILSRGGSFDIPEEVTLDGSKFTVTGVSTDAIGEVTNNTFVFISHSISYSGHAANVIVEHENGDKTCERMVLTDTASFSMPFKVTVKELVYQRRLASRIHPYAVCLPYSMQSTSDGLQFFGFEKAEGDSLIFREITGDTEAYVPYLVVSHTDITDLGGNDVVLNSRSRNTDMYDGAYGFIGSLSPISNGEAVQMKACSLSDNGDWQRITSGGERILSFRSWLYNTSAKDGFIKLVPVSKPVVVVTPDSVSISPSELEMERGQSVKLNGTAFPGEASQLLTWQSSNPSVATVKDDGTVTALSWGRAVIKATSISNMQLSDSCIVTVRGLNDKETVNDIEYTISKTDDESKTVTITHIGSSILSGGGSFDIPEDVMLDGSKYTVIGVSADAIGEVTNNTLVFIPHSISYSGHVDNVIVEHENGDKVCEKLILIDGVGYNTAHSFLARELVYRRELKVSEYPYSICLPYEMFSSEDGLQFFTVLGTDADTLILQEIVGSTEAYAPYVVYAHTDVTELGGKNVWMPTRSKNTDIYEGKFGFIGALQPLGNHDAVSMSASIIDGEGNWRQIVEGEDIIPAFRSWLWAPQGVPVSNRISDTKRSNDTAIDEIKTNNSNGIARYYNILGEYVGDSLDSLPKGIYIVNGKKIYKR